MNGKVSGVSNPGTEEVFRMDLLDSIEGAVFDLDGTLVDSMPFHISAWQETLREYGIAISSEWLMTRGGVPSYVIAEMLTSGKISPAGKPAFPAPRELARIKTANYRRRIHEIQVFPEMVAVLDYLKSRGVPLAVGTGTQRENAETIISGLYWYGGFGGGHHQTQAGSGDISYGGGQNRSTAGELCGF